MDDQGDEWGDTLAGFDIGDLSVVQREALSSDLTEAGILHAFVGPELQGPAAESELIEHLVAQTRRRGARARRPRGPTVPDQGGPLPRALRLPWGAVPMEVLGLPLAPNWRRFAAYIVEALGFGLVTAVLFRYSAGGAQVFAAAASLTSAIVLVATMGATVGMIVLRMRVVLLTDPDRAAPGWRVATVRYLVAWWPEALMFLLVPIVGFDHLQWLRSLGDIWLVVCFLPILLDPAHRGLHDRVAGTVVVAVPSRRAAR